MATKHYAVMGAGEVGSHLARTLSAEGHRVTIIDNDPTKRRFVEEQLDVGFVLGNGSHMSTLEAADAGSCELFVATSSSDEANLVASLLAKRVGVPKTVVRVSKSEDITRYRKIYEADFKADLLLSTELLTTTRILNSVLGYNTLEVEYLADGAIQIRTIRVEAGSPLHQNRLADIDLPRGSLVLGFISKGEVTVATGSIHAEPGDDALILATSDVINEVERRISRRAGRIAHVVLAGGGETAEAVAAGLRQSVKNIRIIEADRARAEELAMRYPHYDIVHGDATDVSVLNSERVHNASSFIALTGHDEKNLMACLLAQELGVPKITALVQKTETSSLWQKVGLVDVISPRTLAAERIHTYIDQHYEPHILSFETGAAQFMQRKIAPQSAAAGQRLEDLEIPRGLIVAAVLRDGRATVPRGDHKLEVGDEVILFVRQSEADMASLLFPGVGRE